MDRPAGSLRGRLLVATPPLEDPNFDRTVVLLLEHHDDGALGVVLNRPGPTPLEDVTPEWRPLAATPAVVFSGGPVAPDAVIGLARSGTGADPDAFVPVLGDLGTVDLTVDPFDIAGTIDRVRIFAGYSGWSAGQLESEIEGHAWFVVDRADDDPFCDDPAGLWRAVLRRQAAPIAMFAHHPEDTGVN